MNLDIQGPTPSRPTGLHGWLEDRIGIDSIWNSLFLRKIPYGVNPLYTLGFVSLAIFLTQAVTGIILAMYYSPSPDHAYESIRYIMNELPFGQVIRGIHHWGASAMVMVVVLHMLVVFALGAYKYPRELTWVIGVLLLLVVLGFGFTGYLLPWDEKAYWATTVGTNIAGTIPVVGGTVVRILRGGAELGALTLTRFFAAHVLLLPVTLLGLVALHLFLVIRQGVSVPPALWDRTLQKLHAAPTPSANDTASASEEYHERYTRFKDRGRPFFPDLIFDDAIATVIAVLVVIALAVLNGTPLESQADPTNTAYVPRPEWYFMFLFEMLKYFPGALEWFGAVLLPSAVIVILIGLPFFDRRPLRSPRSRPFGMLAASLLVTSVVWLTVLAFQATPPPVPLADQQAARLSPAELAGRQLTRAQNCASCHTIAGQGGTSAPGLDGIGARRDPAYIHSYVENPKNVNPAATMPAFLPPLTHEQVEEITRYLLTLK